jgi:hypothetical protein
MSCCNLKKEICEISETFQHECHSAEVFTPNQLKKIIQIDLQLANLLACEFDTVYCKIKDACCLDEIKARLCQLSKELKQLEEKENCFNASFKKELCELVHYDERNNVVISHMKCQLDKTDCEVVEIKKSMKIYDQRVAQELIFQSGRISKLECEEKKENAEYQKLHCQLEELTKIVVELARKDWTDKRVEILIREVKCLQDEVKHILCGEEVLNKEVNNLNKRVECLEHRDYCDHRVDALICEVKCLEKQVGILDCKEKELSKEVDCLEASEKKLEKRVECLEHRDYCDHRVEVLVHKIECLEKGEEKLQCEINKNFEWTESKLCLIFERLDCLERKECEMQREINCLKEEVDRLKPKEHCVEKPKECCIEKPKEHCIEKPKECCVEKPKEHCHKSKEHC